MKRLWLVCTALAAAAACWDASGPASSARVVLAPLVDTLFIGDTQTPALSVAYFDADGRPQPIGSLTWASGDTTIATVNAAGRVVAKGRGSTLIRATANGVSGTALVVVTRTLEVTLLLDTIYLMPGDTFRVPVEVRRRSGVPPEPRFEAPTQASMTIDSAGLVTAQDFGAPVPFVVRADTAADTGAVHVFAVDDTVGASYFTVFGSVTRRLTALSQGLNYRFSSGSQGFRLNLALQRNLQTVEHVIVTVLDSVTVPTTFPVDSLSIDEAFGVGGVNFACRPTRSWGLWGTRELGTPLDALSRDGGTLAISGVDSVNGRLVASGWLRFDAQRVDIYDEPGGRVAVRGTFVAPVITNLNTCQ
ncbi:MAG: Ig-like domain-containing protein [Gemmatimonadales bacterium]